MGLRNFLWLLLLASLWGTSFLFIVGLVLLIAPSLLGRVHATTWGLIAVTMAAACYGAAIVYY